MLIDGVEVWSMPSRCYSGSDGWEAGPPDFPNPWGGQNGQVCFQEVQVFVPCSDSMNLRFVSAIDQAEADESWGFSGVRVTARSSAAAAGHASANVLLLLREDGASPAGWTNSEVTDVGSAGLIHGPWGLSLIHI